MRVKLKTLLDLVEKETEKAGMNFENAKKSAQEISASAAGSPSQAGDRFHSQGTADLAKQKLDSISLLRNELKNVVGSNMPDFVKASCYIRLGEMDIYLVDNLSVIQNFNLVSAKSPLGKALINRKVGDVVNNKKILEIG